MTRYRYNFFILSVLLLFPTALLSTPKPPPPFQADFPIVVHMASATPEKANQKIDAMVNDANAQFAEIGIHFTVIARHSLPATFETLETIRERHQVKKYLQPKAINLFLHDEILDPVPSKATRKAAALQNRKPSGRLAGAHIESPQRNPGTYILISGAARNNTLPHELGHFFGLPHHRNPENIMSYGAQRREFSDVQSKTIVRTAKRLIRQKKIRTVSVPKSIPCKKNS
ncbi:MAG: hypothetical protein JXX29_19995 [Deltaproteobacteria bacterium]|nr:hypothetical protein [Deltaproteobacteria bacterium]MBN2673974.1 hypothetical protein [Deltaproteobacteria bacterium]